MLMSAQITFGNVTKVSRLGVLDNSANYQFSVKGLAPVLLDYSQHYEAN